MPKAITVAVPMPTRQHVESVWKTSVMASGLSFPETSEMNRPTPPATRGSSAHSGWLLAFPAGTLLGCQLGEVFV